MWPTPLSPAPARRAAAGCAAEVPPAPAAPGRVHREGPAGGRRAAAPARGEAGCQCRRQPCSRACLCLEPLWLHVQSGPPCVRASRTRTCPGPCPKRFLVPFAPALRLQQNVQQMAAQQVLQYSLAVMHGPPAPPPAAPGLPAPGIALPPLASHPPAQLSAEPVTGIPLMPGSPPATLPCGPLAAVAAAAAAAAAAEARRNGSGAAAALSSRPPLPVPSGAQHKAHLPPPNKGLAMRSLQGMQRLQPGLALEQQHQQLQQTPPKLPLEAKAAPAGGMPQMPQQPPALSGAAHGPVAAMAEKQGDLEHDGRASGPAVAAAAAGINGAASGSRPAASGIATAAGQSLPRLMVRTDPAKERKPPGSGPADAPATPTDRSAC